MITKNFGLFNFIDLTNWYEIFDYQSQIDYKLFLYFISNFEAYFDQIDLNTIYNAYSNKKFDFKVGIDLTDYHIDYACRIHFWIEDKHFSSIYRVPYNLYDNFNVIIINNSIPSRIKNHYSRNKNTIFYYIKN